ncbi:hypothetical protein JR316_0012321 [Psilocybe cubensis]|uniref:Uncharacterized protein n=1 Tax=Psilocybe cubensis TaxID=181762 RepID=A0ACB8GHM2_PSICU|nr:hypothetical protein JR316_0012321 [Psilocybe cubensis]KAH9475210.1 hypothetical protein JR316_0012321 [Psilocybe cubensis]
MFPIHENSNGMALMQTFIKHVLRYFDPDDELNTKIQNIDDYIRAHSTIAWDTEAKRLSTLFDSMVRRPNLIVYQRTNRSKNDIPFPIRTLDVDLEALASLEEEMFEVSSRAGLAGNYQWGLDAGEPQGWFPYAGVPDYYNHGDIEIDSDEGMTGPNFVKFIQPTEPKLVEEKRILRPRPIPENRTAAKAVKSKTK